MIAVDTNILIYARREEMPLHDKALAELHRLAEGDLPWALPLFCVGEFVRVVSHPRLFAPVTKTEAAMNFINALLESPTARLLIPNEGFLEVFARLVSESKVTGNTVFDAQIAALCLHSGVREILTEDRDFQRFPELKVMTL